jgi:hypothetical protein
MTGHPDITRRVQFRGTGTRKGSMNARFQGFWKRTQERRIKFHKLDPSPGL